MANTSASLFPILQARPSGIARLAAEAEHAQDGHLVEFRRMEVRSLLNRTMSKRRLSLAWSINPYRGCEFGCRYCYARYTHEFLAAAQPATEVSAGAPLPATPDLDLRSAEAFERRIFIKQGAAWLLEQELRRVDPAEEIAIGTATDPYQPVERHAKVTRSILEVLARRSGYRIGIVTKSKLIERDIDLLVRIARQNTLVVHLTITTADAALARLLEPRAPRPDLRLQAVRHLRDAGICTGILASPLLPGLTDSAAAIDEMARHAARVRASFFAAEPLFLKPCSRPTYLSFVREHFPALEAENAARFAHAEFASRPYRQEKAALVREACRRHGVPQRSTDALLTRDAGVARRPPAGWPSSAPMQQQLFA